MERVAGRSGAADAALAAEVVASGDPATLAMRVGVGPVSGSARLRVAVVEHPGTFALLTGCLELAGLDIMEATATASMHVGLYGFTVAPATGAAIEHVTWSRLERLVRAGLAGNLALETRLAERRHHYDRIRMNAPVRVSVDAAESHVIMRVSAPDRVGLLHDIAAEVLRSGLLIQRVQTTTLVGVARDVLFLDSPSGSGSPQPGVLGHLAMNLREGCAS